MKKLFYHLSILFISTLLFKQAGAQQIMLQGWYWDYPKTADGKSWADTLRLKAASLKQSGFTHVWFPPHAVASFGTNSNGYDPKDLFIGNQTTGLATRPNLNAMLAEFTNQGIAPVADIIYNHRDGGAAEVNPAVKDYITNYYSSGKTPFPSDRYRVILPLGGSSGNGAGDYYFKLSSKTGDGGFNGKGYKVYMETQTKGFAGLSAQNETEPNGGGDCGQANNDLTLGRDILATVETGGSCGTDEFHLNLTASDFNTAGDTLYIYLTNTGDYTDHRIYGLWNGSADVVNNLLYQTYTNFDNMPSGRGQMNYEFFKPNSSNASSTFLNGDWDGMYFFYDYDQFQKRTKDTLINYTKWNWEELGVRGFRMDAVKHFTPEFVGDMLDSMHKYNMDPSLVVGEWYSTNTSELKSWVNNVNAAMDAATQAAIKPKIFDFSLRENLRQACDNSSFDVRNIFSGSLHDAESLSGFNIVTFVNNHDFRDGSGFASLIRNNPDLAYAYILTNNQLGVPTVFYPDYYGYPAASGGLYGYHPTTLPAYKDKIDRLMKALKTYINGSPSVDYLNRLGTPYSSNFLAGSAPADKALIYQLEGFAGNGNKDVIVAINFSSTALKVDHAINTRGGAITSGTQFTDVLGNSAFPFQVVNGSNQVYFELPPFSYSIWVQGEHFLLPLELKSFTAYAQDKKSQVEWVVTDNEEAAGFEVQRSDDGINFSKIGFVSAKNISGEVAYQFTDQQPKMNVGMLYRLKIVFKDGKQQYSDLKLVRINSGQLLLSLQGNPVSDKLKLLVSSGETSLISASVINMNGQQIKSQQFNIAQGTNIPLEMEVGSLAAGVYQLVIKNNSETKTISFVKK